MPMENTLRTDNDWKALEGDACRVIEFRPFAYVEGETVTSLDRTFPYASVELECTKLAGETVGFITHKTDFKNLWAAFKERGVEPDEEVIIFWSKKHLKGYAKLFSVFMPRLWVMICKQGAYELMTDPNCKPELGGEARYLAGRPIVDWKPDVFE
jgi:hypothetical protein